MHEGVWLVVTDDAQRDDSGWYIIHWPSLIRGIFANKGIQGLLSSWGFADPIYGHLPSQAPDLFDEQWRSFKRWFDLEALPAGAFIWNESPDFQRLTSFIDPKEHYPDTFTVFRAGMWMSTRFSSVTEKIEAYHPLKLLASIDPITVLPRTPKPFQLVYWALRGSKGIEDAFNSWGVAWTSRGLHLHYGRALARAQITPHLRDQFAGEKYEHYLGPWLEDHTYTKRSTLPGIPALDKIVVRHDYQFFDHSIEPYRITKGKLWNDLIQTDGRYIAENHWLFPLNKREHTLFSYIAQLVRLSHDPKILEDARRVRKAHKKPSSTTTRRKRTRQVSIFTLDERQLGYEPPAGTPYDQMEGLTIRALKYYKETYIAFPDLIALHYPEVLETKWFDRRRIAKPMVWADPSTNAKHTLNISRTHLGPKTAASIFYEGVTYLHPALMHPDGEAMSFLRELAAVHQTTDYIARAFIECFDNFLKWVHQPERLLEGDGMFGAELESLIDPEVNCPIKLENYADRLDFFFQKGLKMQHRGFAYQGKPGTHGKRSLRLTEYDKWVLWYAATYELPFLGCQLNKKQQREFMAKRWAQWRRPDSLKGKLVAPPLTGRRLPQLPLSASIDELVQKAEDTFGPSFTSY